MPIRPSLVAAAVLAIVALPAAAATSVALPDWTCTHPDAIYSDAFDAPQAPVPHDQSAGSGGAFPGAQTRTVHVAGLGDGAQDYYVFVPDGYDPSRPLPLLLALHGVAPYAGADGYALNIRDDWAAIATTGNFIVAAPVANQVIYSNGSPYAMSWLLPYNGRASDYDLFAAVRADMEAAYNIDRTRVYGWGFSAGGHVMHDLAISQHSSAFNASTMAAYGVSGADLANVACAGYTSAGCDDLLNALPRKIPVDIHIGNSDPNYPYAKADHLRFVADGWVNHETIFYWVFVGGHEYTIQQLGQIWSSLCPNAVTP